MLRSHNDAVILGGGMTGLSAGIASGFPVVEARRTPGGICTSYYVRPNESERLERQPADGEAYHFEHGGGHWIFGGDRIVRRFLQSLGRVKGYARKSGIYLPSTGACIPYPIQNHLSYLGRAVAERALEEILSSSEKPCRTAEEWCRDRFGRTLCEIFFNSFNDLYTAGLWRRVAPQDNYKSPLNRNHVIRGAEGQENTAGYNATFLYPVEGLGGLALKMAQHCDIHYGARVVQIDAGKKKIRFEDGSQVTYKRLICSLPLNRVMDMAGLTATALTDPCTSVLVLNIGAMRGPRIPEDHWLYTPGTKSGFHRVGIYSNVDPAFLPASSRADGKRVSLYIERAFEEGKKPDESAVSRIGEDTVRELQDWGFIEKAEVVNPTWIDVAYTWTWPDSTWREEALNELEEHDIIQVGRYGRWVFQGIADSIREGLLVGTTLRRWTRR